MSLFRRAVAWLFLAFGLIVGFAGSAAAFFAQRLIKPPRPRFWATPADLGLKYEDVAFLSEDGVSLSGWFVPAPVQSMRKNATIVLRPLKPS